MKITGNNLTIVVDGALGHFPEEFVKSAIEKKIPKKVEIQTEDDREFIDYVCPCCQTTLQQKMKCATRTTIHKAKCCDECGQALDWSDSE